MDGKNSSGGKISLLNDSSDVAPLAAKAQPQLPPLAAHYSHHHPHHLHHHHQHPNSNTRASSSCDSTPSLSPQTPQLVRHDSSDSRGFATPSPLTPSYNSFQHEQSRDQHHHASHPHAQHKAPQQYFVVAHRQKMDDPTLAMYPQDATLQMPSAYPLSAQMPAQMSAPPVQPPTQQQVYRSSNSPASEPSRVSTVSNASNTNGAPRPVAPKKNQYPCPLSKQFNCSDYFTTSGHAARHAKKHTGKKDAFCPECNKAFTRKDNMEQHRRTHQNGRGAARTNGAADDSKVKKSTKPAPKKAATKEPAALEAAVEQQLAEQAPQVSQPQMPVSQAPMQTLPPPPVPQQQTSQSTTDPAILIPPVSGGPYYLNSVDSGPVPSLPMPALNEGSVRPPLHRSTYASSLDYFPPQAQMMGGDDGLNFTYPSPGLSNGLNSLALAASEHRRLSEEKSAQNPSSEGPTP